MVYLFLVQVFCTSFRGARRPLAREPDEHLNEDITETNFSIDFSAISEYCPKWDMLHPNFSSLASVSINESSRSELLIPNVRNLYRKSILYPDENGSYWLYILTRE